jgi:ribosome-binding factor A
MNEGIEKINSSINYFLAYFLQDKYPDTIFSITEVNTSTDLSICIVFISVLSDNNNFVVELNNSAKFIRMKLAKNVALRKIPELRFTLDNSETNYQKIDKLLK